MKAESLSLDDSWAGVTFQTEEELPVVLRYRPNLYNFIEAGHHTDRMDITWRYDPADETLLPDNITIAAMREVEDALVEILEQDNQTILAFVFTGESEKCWAWYTTDIEIAGERLNIALAKFKKLPITIVANADPQWDEYIGVLEDFGENS